MHTRRLVYLLAVTFLLVSCKQDVSKVPSDEPFSDSNVISKPFEESASGKQFHRLSPDETGIVHKNKLDLDHPYKATYASGWVCGGVMVADFNNDGRTDLFFPQSAGKNKLYLQSTESLKFTEVSAAAGVTGGDGFAAGGAVGDIDGDGDIDIYLCNHDSPNQLLINQGNNAEGVPKFEDLATSAGINLSDATLNASFCDYDRDGDLDLFVLSNRFYHPTGFPHGELYEIVDGQPKILPHLQKYYVALLTNEPNKRVLVNTAGRPCYLYENTGNNSKGLPVFKDVSERSGIGGFRNYGLSSIWHDFNDDGWPDLYIANDYEYDDRLFINRGDGTFASASSHMFPSTPYYSMGSTVADFDGDAREDLFVVDMAATSHYKAKVAMGALTQLQTYVLDNAEPRQAMRNMLLLNSGSGKMREAAYLAGIAKSDWSWTPLAADFDNDGDNDLLITNGMARDFANADLGVELGHTKRGVSEWDQFENTPERPETNLAFQNHGKLEFKKIAKQWGLDHTGMSYAAVWADLDGDGRLEIIVSNLNEPPSIYHNRVAGDNNAVTISLHQPGSLNKQAIGATVTMISAGKKQVRSLQPAVGFLSSNQPIIHFGIGSAEIIDTLTIRWPDGSSQNHHKLAANHHHKISRSKDARPASQPVVQPTLLTRNTSLDGSDHVDPKFDDFKLQPLLPNKLSHQGPGHAWADLNGDGAADFYLASGAGEADRIYWNKNGKFVRDIHPALEADASGESIAPLIFDIDGDGDDDIYVARGSYEFPVGDQRQSDRIYLNDGKGNFSALAHGVIPNNNTVSGHLAAADIDRDGDLDILIASRVTPGAYPLAPASRLLRNDSTPGNVVLTDITASHAPELAVAGMVTAAVFSDATGNGNPDILLTTEYGPVVLLENTGSKFEKKDHCTTLAGLHGWWHSITPCDVDQDGDMDYVVGNLGTNTKYHPKAKAPYFIFYGDMDGSGNKRVVEAKTPKAKAGNQKGEDQVAKNRPLPVRGRS